jgi:hypothetical protein
MKPRGIWVPISLENSALKAVLEVWVTGEGVHAVAGPTMAVQQATVECRLIPIFASNNHENDMGIKCNVQPTSHLIAQTTNCPPC